MRTPRRVPRGRWLRSPRGWLLWGVLVVLACDLEVEQARRMLESPEAALRASALDTLAATRDPRHAETAARFLKDSSARVRRRAVAALGTLGPGPYISALASRFNDNDLEVRLAALRVLGDSGAASSKKLILPLLRDSSQVIRHAASQALRGLGLDDVAQARATAGLDIEEELVRLTHPDEAIRAAAVQALGRTGRAHLVPILAQVLSDPSPTMQREAADALGAIGGVAAETLLLASARAAKSSERLVVASAVGRLAGAGGSARVREALARLLADEDRLVRYATFNSYASIVSINKKKQSIDIKTICNFLADMDLALPAATLVSSQDLACPQQETALIAKLASSPSPETLEVLRRLRSEAVDQALLAHARRVLEQHRLDAESWLKPSDWNALSPVRTDGADQASELPSVRPSGRSGALDKLLARFPEQTPESDAGGTLLPPRVQAEATTQAIAALAGRPLARAFLVEIADGTAGEGPQIAALLALQNPLPEAGSVSAVPFEAQVRAAVEASLRSARPPVKLAAAQACALLGPSAAGMASALLREADFALRSAGARCLGQIKAREAVPALLELLRRERAAAAIEALAEIGDARVVPDLLALLRDDGPEGGAGERILVIKALGMLADRTAAPALERELLHPDWQVRLAAAMALSRTGRPQSRTPLRLGQEDVVLEVREACRRSLAALRGAGARP